MRVRGQEKSRRIGSVRKVSDCRRHGLFVRVHARALGAASIACRGTRVFGVAYGTFDGSFCRTGRIGSSLNDLFYLIFEAIFKRLDSFLKVEPKFDQFGDSGVLNLDIVATVVLAIIIR